MSWCTLCTVGVNQPVHWFLGGKGLGIQQGTSVWVGSPKSSTYLVCLPSLWKRPWQSMPTSQPTYSRCPTLSRVEILENSIESLGNKCRKLMWLGAGEGGGSMVSGHRDMDHGEMRNYCVWEHLSFIQSKIFEMVCILEGCSFSSWFDIGISFEDSKLIWLRSFEMNGI